MRPSSVASSLWKALLAVMLVSAALPSPVEAQTPPAQTQSKAKTQKSSTKAKKSSAKTQSKAKSKSKSKAEPQAPEKPPAPPPTAEEKARQEQALQEKARQEKLQQEQAKAREQEKAKAQERAREQAKAEEEARARVQARAEEQAKAKARPPEKPQTPLRVGLGLDFYTENSHLSGEQIINGARRDESFDYSSDSILSATLTLSFPAPIASQRTRLGVGARAFGHYGSGGERVFGFGVLNQLFVLGEYGLPVAKDVDVLFGARGGLSLLIPGKDLSQEIQRLRDNGVDAWNVPRLGWMLGLNVGGRWHFSTHFAARGDLSAQLEKLYLFKTSQDVNVVQFDKNWSTFGLRLGLTLGIEFAL
jgi:outer membrane biosynthesis protein TonB